MLQGQLLFQPTKIQSDLLYSQSSQKEFGYLKWKAFISKICMGESIFHGGEQSPLHEWDQDRQQMVDIKSQ